MKRPSDEGVSGSSAVVVRKMTSSDLTDVLAIIQEGREAAQWSEGSVREVMSWSSAWIAGRGIDGQNGPVAGFLVGRVVADEFEILNMAVAKGHRRRGIAAQLLSEALAWSRTAGARRAYLEVRASNKAAISLYDLHGFREFGRRTGYYTNPVEDAILFALEGDQAP